MRRLVGWGNNVAQNITPSGEAASLIDSPRDITDDVKCDSLLWHSWSCSIGRSSDRKHVTWGSAAPSVDSYIPIDKVIGNDEPLGWLGMGHFGFLNGRTLAGDVLDVAVTGLGDVYMIHEGGVLRHYISLDHYLRHQVDYERRLRLNTHRLQEHTLYAMESRCYLLEKTHPSRASYERKHRSDRSQSNRYEGVAQCSLYAVERSGLRVIDELEGIGIWRVVAGRRNRLGVITEAGDVCILDAKTKDFDWVQLEDDAEVDFLGLGSDFDVVVTSTKVMTRGSNEFGQLGRKASEGWGVVDVDAKSVVDVQCGRWSTILTLEVRASG